MKYNGFQVSPAELEAILITHPAVAEACVVGVPDLSAGDLPKAFIVLKPSFQRSSELGKEIAEYLAGKVAPFKRLRGGVEFIDEIAKNTMNKMQRNIYRELERKRAEERELAAAAGKAKL